MFDVELSNQAARFLRRAHKILSERIWEKLDGLRENQIPSDAKHIKGGNSAWRLRVGDYRILYYICYERKLAVIAKIEHRSKVYEC